MPYTVLDYQPNKFQNCLIACVSNVLRTCFKIIILRVSSIKKRSIIAMYHITIDRC